MIRIVDAAPRAPFADISASLMVPDVIVRRNKRKWIAELNSVAVPRLAVNSVYADMLHREKEGRSTPLSTQLQEARWLVKNVAQRFDTILRVSSEIVERQMLFLITARLLCARSCFAKSPTPCSLHESTVSRVTTQKYLSCMRALRAQILLR